MHFTNPHFFLLAYKPCILEALIDNIWLKITNTGNNVPWRMVDKMQCHVQVCLADGGGNFQHWCKVIRFTMNSCVTLVSFHSVHTLWDYRPQWLRHSIRITLYKLLILCDFYMVVKISLTLTEGKRLAAVTTTNRTENFDWGLRNQWEWEKGITMSFTLCTHLQTLLGVMKGRMRCVRHVAFSKNNRSAHRMVCQKPKTKKPIGKCKGNKNNKMYLTKKYDRKHWKKFILLRIEIQLSLSNQDNFGLTFTPAIWSLCGSPGEKQRQPVLWQHWCE